MNRKASLVKVASMLSMIGLAAAPGLLQAAEDMRFYVGADLVQLTSELTPSGTGITGEFTTTNLRLKGGLNISEWLAVEAQLLTSADNTDDAFGGTYTTGTIVGIFAKPHVTFGQFDLYGLLGYATAAASLDCAPVSCPPEWEATLDGVAYGLGVQYLVSKQLKISLDYMVYNDGSATFDDGFFPFKADTMTTGFGLGVNYTF